MKVDIDKSGKALLSLCIPTYNHAQKLRKSLERIVGLSVFQDTKEIEIVISKNGVKFGEEELSGTGQGRAYGIELMARWIIQDKLNMIGSATLYKSEYRSEKSSNYISSAWDNRFIINMSAVYDLPKSWSIGAKVSAIGGAPYTPYDEEGSSYKVVWDSNGRPIVDYSLYNTLRLNPYVQLDIRIDKSFYFKKWTLSIYLDMENVTFSKIQQQDAYLSSGEIMNPEAELNLQRYRMEELKLWSGTIVPTLGVTVEF